MNGVDTRLLKANMVLHGYTIDKLAKELDVSPKTLSTRLNSSPEKFTQGEMEKIISVLKIKNPLDIFFTQWSRKT